MKVQEDYMEKISRMEIYSSTGKQLGFTATNTSENSIAVSSIDSYVSGLVFVRLVANGISITQKVLINK